MSRKDAHLRAIRAEIHQCRNELVFLGSGLGSMKESRDEALKRVVVHLNQVSRVKQIKDTPLKPFVDGVIPLLNELRTTDFSGRNAGLELLNRYYETFNSLLTTLATNDTALSNKFNEIKENIAKAAKNHNANLDIYLQTTLHMISAHMMLIYYEFSSEEWLKPVAMSIPTISHMLEDA